MATGFSDHSTEVIVRDALFEAKDKFLQATGGSELAFMREYEWAMQALRKNAYTADVARNNTVSLRDAIVNAATAGLSLDPTRAHAYLVPRDGMICLDPSYRGLRDLAISDGILVWCRSEIVYEGDDYDDDEMPNGDRIIMHKNKDRFSDGRKIIGGYCVWQLPNGHRDFITENLTELYDSHRSRSIAWTKVKNGKAAEEGIWKTDEREAIKKSLIKRAHKSWPRTAGMGERFDAAMAAAIHADDDIVSEGETVQTIAGDDKRIADLADMAAPNVEKWCGVMGVKGLSELTLAQADELEKRIKARKKAIADAAAKKAKSQAKQQPDPPVQPSENPPPSSAPPATPPPGDDEQELAANPGAPGTREQQIYAIRTSLQNLSAGSQKVERRIELEARKHLGIGEGALDSLSDEHLAALRDKLEAMEP